MISSEAVAAAILREILSIKVNETDDGTRPGMHDLELVRDGMAVACVEVTSTILGDIAALRNELRQRGRRIPAPELRGTWELLLGRDARVKKFEKDRGTLVAILREFEETGTAQASTLLFDESHDQAEFLRKMYGVRFCSRLEDGPEGEILLGEAPTGGAFGVSQLVEAAEREAAKDDNIRKLHNCTLDQRHFFVFIDADTDTGPSLAMNHPSEGLAELPRAPRLPDAIQYTTVWLATWTDSNTYRVWRCPPGGPWEDLGTLTTTGNP
jgi:hypothetical protein